MNNKEAQFVFLDKKFCVYVIDCVLRKGLLFVISRVKRLEEQLSVTHSELEKLDKMHSVRIHLQYLKRSLLIYRTNYCI